MLAAIAEIEDFTRGMDQTAFAGDLKTIRAVSYNFLVLGEAARTMPPDVEARYPLVAWAKIRGMRNIVAHQYRHVSISLLWSTLKQDLPAVTPLLREILTSET
jgi:uncharacterized protein with HEPN domain